MASERERARAELDAQRDRALWDCRVTSVSGAVVLNVWAMEREALTEALASVLFTHHAPPNRGEYLRVELWPNGR